MRLITHNMLASNVKVREKKREYENVYIYIYNQDVFVSLSADVDDTRLSLSLTCVCMNMVVEDVRSSSAALSERREERERKTGRSVLNV